jgi:hypothetical protein
MTPDEIILMADASGISLYGMGKDRAKFIHYLEAFAKLVAEAEREACAKVCDDIHDKHEAKDVFSSYAEAIRARGQA